VFQFCRLRQRLVFVISPCLAPSCLSAKENLAAGDRKWVKNGGSSLFSVECIFFKYQWE